MKGETSVMAKNQKVGSIAVPYLVTIFIGILVIGGGTFFFLHKIGVLGGEKELSEPPPKQVATTTYEDNHTILFILDEPEQKCSSTFVLMRSIPKDKKLVFVCIPSNTIALIDDAQQSIKLSYEQGGAASAVKFTEAVFGITIDKYMKLDANAFIKICDILGGVTYPVEEDIAGFNGDGSSQYLNSEQINKLVTYAMYAGGETDRAQRACSIIANMVNQSDLVRVSDNFDNSFNSIVNMTETDITAIDYKKHKVAIKTMLERGSAIATPLPMDGTDADSDFIPNQGFLNDFKDKFYTQYENK
jgi:anionic cell wall polymer biosynthesis LytR-Cps2A-Psr (LCP) family protein